MAVGSVAAWRAQEGQEVKAGDVYCEVATDKATVDFNAVDDGVMALHLVSGGKGEEVPVGAPIFLLAEDAAAMQAFRAAGKSREEWRALVGAGSGSGAPAAAAPVAAPTPASAVPPSTAPAAQPAPAARGHSDVESAIASLPATAVMPSARALLAEHGVHPSGVKGSGKGGRITKGDVLSHLAGGSVGAHAAAASSATATAGASAGLGRAGAVAAAAAAAPSSYRASRPPVAPKIAPDAIAKAFPALTRADAAHPAVMETKPSQVRRVIAARLAESKATIPHQYAVQDCVIDAALKLRSHLKAAGIAISVNDVVIKAVARALRDVPEANCFYDANSDTVRPNATVDISVAVATEGGLITPIVKGADKLGFAEISDRVKDLATRARAGRLKPEEFQGGSFTISNLGMFGIDEFSAVINPPQACILAVGRGEKKVVAAPLASIDDWSLAAEEVPPPTLATVMSVMLSSDARVVDAPVAGQFLQAFNHYIANPTLMSA